MRYSGLLIRRERIRRNWSQEGLPVGYALFHLPWVQEWHAVNRQYKQAYELLRDFPDTIR